MGKARCGHEASIKDSNHCVNLLCGNHGAGARIIFNSELHYSHIPQDWFLRAYATSVGMEVLLDDGKKHHVAFFNNEGYCRNATSHETRVEAISTFQELIREDLYSFELLPHGTFSKCTAPKNLSEGVVLNPGTFMPEYRYMNSLGEWATGPYEIKNPCGEIFLDSEQKVDEEFRDLLGK